MPLARQYGLTYDEFWHGDMRLLSVYQKGYFRDKSYTAWLQGQFDCVAYSVAMSNAFAKKGSKQAEYPQWKDPFEKFNKPKITKDNLEYEFRKQQSMQQAWLFNR
jgi:hypothetical protein